MFLGGELAASFSIGKSLIKELVMLSVRQLGSNIPLQLTKVELGTCVSVLIRSGDKPPVSQLCVTLSSLQSPKQSTDG